LQTTGVTLNKIHDEIKQHLSGAQFKKAQKEKRSELQGRPVGVGVPITSSGAAAQEEEEEKEEEEGGAAPRVASFSGRADAAAHGGPRLAAGPVAGQGFLRRQRPPPPM
jgi:hypothetical protein